MSRLNLENQIFGDLKVLKFYHINKGKSYWLTLCAPCKKEHVVCGTDLKRGKIKNCGCTKNKQERNGQWKGHEGLWGKTISHYKYNAEKRGIKFNVSPEYLWKQFLKQEKKCPYTGKYLILESKDITSRTPENASLDRIDSSKGYINGNVQWVYKKVNIIKNDLNHKEFIELCNIISSNYKSKNK